jgi:hypothetical protein
MRARVQRTLGGKQILIVPKRGRAEPLSLYYCTRAREAYDDRDDGYFHFFFFCPHCSSGFVTIRARSVAELSRVRAQHIISISRHRKRLAERILLRYYCCYYYYYVRIEWCVRVV